MITLFNDVRFKDLIFRLDDGEILVHKCIVAVANVEYFQKLFDKNIQLEVYKIDPITNMMIIESKDCTIAEFSYIVKFSYGITPRAKDFFDKDIYNFDQLELMISAADRFGCQSLIDSLTWLADVFNQIQKNSALVILTEILFRYPSCFKLIKHLLSSLWIHLKNETLSVELLLQFFKLYDVEVGNNHRGAILGRLLAVCNDNNILIELAKEYELLSYCDIGMIQSLIKRNVYPDITDKLAKHKYVVVEKYPLKLAYSLLPVTPIHKYESKLKHFAKKGNIHSIALVTTTNIIDISKCTKDINLDSEYIKFDENGYLDINCLDKDVKYLRIYFYEV